MAAEQQQLPDPAWPSALVEQLRDRRGPLASSKPLGGMSGGCVWRVRFEDASVIVKRSASAAESRFYEQAANTLRLAGVPSPRLEWALHLPDAHWLILEDIPAPLPVQPAHEWRPDPRIIAIMARLHAVTRSPPPDLPDVRPQAWTDAMTTAALSLFQPKVADELAPLLGRLQQESQHIFEPWCWISGDPNPLNWGLRADGSPVLFDWELFGPGTPAIDLAIIIPGLGNAGQYAAVADYYVAFCAQHSMALPWSTAQLTHDIALAKVASVVRLLDSCVAGTARVGDDLVAWIGDTVPAWVLSLA